MLRRRAKTDSRSSNKDTCITRETALTTLSKGIVMITLQHNKLFVCRYKLLGLKKEKLFTNITVEAYKIAPGPKKKSD